MGSGKDPLGILTPSASPKLEHPDPLGILKKKEYLGGVASKFSGGASSPTKLPLQKEQKVAGLTPTGRTVDGVPAVTIDEERPATIEDKLKLLGVNDITFEKQEEKPTTIFESALGFKPEKQPVYIDIQNPESLAYLSSKLQEAKKNADPYKYGQFADKSIGLKFNQEFSNKAKVADELMVEVSKQASKNAFNKTISNVSPSLIERKDLIETGLEYLKQVDHAQYQRNKTILDEGEDLGDENKYNIEKIGGAILKNNLPSVTGDAYDLSNIENLDKLTDEAHPEIATAKGWDIIGAYNHKKDNEANNGWWRTRPTVGQVKKWLDDPELLEMFKGNEVALEQIKKQVGEMPESVNGFKIEDVPVGGFLNNFGRSMGRSIENVANIFRGDVKRQQANLNPTLEKGFITGDYNNPGGSPALLQQLYSLEAAEKDGTITEPEKAELKALRNSTKVRDGWDKFADGTGNLSGQVVSQVLLQKGIGLGTGASAKLLNIGKSGKTTIDAGIASSLISYDQSRQQAIYSFPDDKEKQNIYTGVMVFANAASERIFKDEKVLDAFKKELRGDLVNYVKNLSVKNINKAAVKNLVAEKLVKFGGQTIKEANKEAIEETVAQVVNEVSQATMGAEGYEGDKAIERIGNTYGTTLLYGGAVAGLAAKSNTDANKFNRVGIYRMATNPEIFHKELQRQYEAGEISKQEMQDKGNILNKATEIAAAEPPKVSALSTKKKAEYLTQQLNIAINEEKLQDAKDPNQQAELKTNIEEGQKMAKDIYDSKPEVLEEIEPPKVTERETLLSQAADIAKTEGAIKGYTSESLKTAAENNPQQFEGFLKEISEQAQDPKSRENTISTYGKELVDIADKLFPDSQPKQLTEKDITKAADEAGIKWDNDPAFMAKSKELTGVEHLSEMNQEQLKKMKGYVTQERELGMGGEKIKEQSDIYHEYNNKNLKVQDGDLKGRGEFKRAVKELEGNTGESAVRRVANIGELSITENIYGLSGEKDLSKYEEEIKNGIQPPIVVEFNGNRFDVVDGHHRLEAYKKLGYKEVPIVVNESGDFYLSAKSLGTDVANLDKMSPKEIEKIRSQINEQKTLPESKQTTNESNTQAPSIEDGKQQKGGQTGLVLYHGSPHSFKNFDISKLGSGEGAQAFGSGLYFTNEKSIASGYANRLGSRKNFWDALREGNALSLSKEDFDFIKKEVDTLGFDGYKAEQENLGNIKVGGKDEFAPDVLEALAVAFGKNSKSELEGFDLTKEQIDKFLEIKKKISDPQLYKVAVHEGKSPSEYDYIDWREQLTDAQRKKIGGLREGITGEQAYKILSKELGSDQKASEFLLSKGVDGITYKSAKGTGGKSGEGRNYVIFDSKSIRVDEINEQKQPSIEDKTEPKQEQVKPSIGGKVKTPKGDGIIAENKKGTKIVELEDGSTVLYTPDLWEGGKKEKTVATKTESETTQDNLKELVDKYDEGDIGTFGDLVTEVEKYAKENGNENLLAAIDKYRREQEYDRSVSGRGDMDAAQTALEKVIEAESKPVKPSIEDKPYKTISFKKDKDGVGTLKYEINGEQRKVLGNSRQEAEAYLDRKYSKNENKTEPTQSETAEQKKTKLTEQRDAEILEKGKPEIKMEFVAAKELVDSKDPIGNKKVHSEIKDRYKDLRKLLDCLWA